MFAKLTNSAVVEASRKKIIINALKFSLRSRGNWRNTHLNLIFRMLWYSYTVYFIIILVNMFYSNTCSVKRI